jgi:glycosyltransferase involved in cell wall biosynthesis
LRALEAGESIASERDAPVVLVVAAGALTSLQATLRLVVRHTSVAVPLVIACGAEDAASLGTLELERDAILLELGSQAGCAAALRALNAAAPHVDVALLGAGVLVGAGWLDGLRLAAHADSIVMTASPLSVPADDEEALEARAQAVARAASGLAPAIPRMRADCCYIRACALELVGPPPAGLTEARSLAAFSDSISALGLVHVLAPEVAVHAGEDEELLAEDSSMLRRAVAVAQTSLRPLGVTVDARALGTAATGTRTYILDLIAAFARDDSVRLRVVLPPDASAEVLGVLEADDAVEVISYEQAAAGVALTDVVHRPQQIFTADDLTLLRLLGERIVITHHDLIAYRSSAYHESLESWRDFRRVTRVALAQADMVVFPSRHARDDALREDLIAPARARAVPDGADRVWPQPPAGSVRPEGVPAEVPLLVCIGADYAHKNRPFAIALAAALRRRCGWRGMLILAGPHVERGSSREREQALLAEDPTLSALVLDIGPVDDAGRAWLYSHAQAIVYPSVYEGFGLVPFEAAQAGVPCLYAATGALGELAGPTAATLVPWDPDASADAVAALLEPGEPRKRHVRQLCDAAALTSWQACIPQLREVYADALASPRRASAPRIVEELEREAHIVALAASAEHDRERAIELERANDAAQRANDAAQRHSEASHEALIAFRESVGAFADPADGGLFSVEERRGLLRVVTRPLLRRTLLAPFALLGRRASAREAPPGEGGADAG